MLLAILASAVPVAFSQNAQISGKVSDSSKAVIPGVDLTITNMDNGAARSAATNGEGAYFLPSLAPGHYQLSAHKTGFKPLIQSGITLQVNDNVELDLKMQVGSATESVTVTADVPVMRKDDAEIGEVIDNRRIEELPQYQRNALAFAQLVPGVSGDSPDQYKSGGSGAEGDFRISGGRTTGNEYYLDGSPMTEGYAKNITNAVPSPEAVQEFKVITSGVSAEYGRFSGGVVSLITRSGTNQFHGSAYEFLKNDLLNANGFWNNFYGTPRNAFHNNIYGGSIGGPIWLPKVYNGHNKTLFFLNYEGDRYSGTSTASLASVPTAAERSGDFSASLIDRGTPVTLYDPTTGTTQCAANGCYIVRQPFLGNVIPQNRMDSVAQIYSKYWPMPNRAPDAGTSHSNNYIGSSSSYENHDRWSGRLDQIWSSRQMSYFTITAYNDSNGSPNWLSALQPQSHNVETDKIATLHHVFTLNSTTILEASAGVLRDVGPDQGSGMNSLSSSVNSADFGFSGNVTGILGQTVGRAPLLQTYDVTDLGGGSGTVNYETDYHFGVSLQKLIGRHNLKFGWQDGRYYTNQMSGGNLTEQTSRTVTKRYPNGDPFAGQTDSSGAPFASFLLGTSVYAMGNQWAGPASLQTAHSLYALDNVKLTNKLTVNAGVRWDFEPPRTERFNRQVFWDPNYKWDVSPAAGWSWQNDLKEAGVTDSVPQPYWMTHGLYGRPAMMGSPEYPHRSIQTSYHDHFSPHIGIAYQIHPQTVARFGYGINWMSVLGNRWLNSAMWNNGYGDAINVQQGTSDNNLTYNRTFENPTPGGSGFQKYQKGSEQNVLNTALGQWYLAQAINTYPGLEHVVMLDLQQQFGSGPNTWVLEINGNANLGRKLPWSLGHGEEIMPNAYNLIGKEGNKLYTNVDNPVYGSVPTQYGAWANQGPTTPLGRVFENNPLYGEAWTIGAPAGTSNYSAMYVQIEHRFGNGYSLLANWTFSKLLQDTGSQEVYSSYDSNGYPQAGLGMHDVYGVAPNDATHKVRVNFSAELPVGQGKLLLGNPSGLGGAILDKVVGGWTLAGTGTFRTGYPLSINTNNQDGFWAGIGQGRTSMRPVFVNHNYSNHVSPKTAIKGGGKPYFNPGSFAIPQGSGIGNVPATMSDLRCCFVQSWDMSLLKNFRLWSDSSHFQLRWEATDVFNQTSFAGPDTTITSGTFGYITAGSGPRVMMVAGKIVF